MPGLPREWTRVLERNDEAMNPEPLLGYVWLDMPGKVRHVAGHELEFIDEPPVQGGLGAAPHEVVAEGAAQSPRR